MLGAALLLLGTLPFSEWIPGGLTDVAYRARWSEWLTGLLICGGALVLGAVAGPHWAVTRSRMAFRSASHRLHELLQNHPRTTDLTLALGAGIVYAWIAWSVFSHRPLLIDEIVQVLQARMYADGNLWIPTQVPREFYSVLHMVDIGERTFSQFPPGWAAMLALGSLVGSEWAVGPVSGVVATYAFARIVRRVHGGASPLVIVGSTILFGFAPFVAFQFGSHMSHGPVTMWLLLAVLAVSCAQDNGRSLHGKRALYVGAGFLAGVAFAVRPLDAIAYASVGAVWLLGATAGANNSVRDRLIRVALAGGGLMIPVAVVMYINVQTTGSPTTFGYEALWGASHGLGFHEAPWGDAHTPRRGIELLSLYATRLNTFLFEAPFPSLLPAIVGLFARASLRPIERVLVVGSVVHGALYFAYWHDGYFLGPRFVVPWVPALVLLTIRGMMVTWTATTRSPRWRGGAVGGMVAAVVLTMAFSVPARITQYRSGLTSMREDYGAEARAAGVTHAIVFVQESWGARLIARMWSAGVSRSAAATLYAKVDACRLEEALNRAAESGVAGRSLETAMRPLLADSSRVRSSVVSPDTTERMLPGIVYSARCRANVELDRAGYALYPPFLLDRLSGNRYVRDFPDRRSEILAQYPGAPAYVTTRRGVDGTAPLTWQRIR